ncbi:MAG: EAL domain-containing protein [Sphingobium sp.]|nr:EAL domain-containing protein [Sphingobium sp.]
MSSGRPQTETLSQPRPGWLITLGGADDFDSEGIEALTKTLRQLGQDWVVVAAARFALLALLIMTDRMASSFGNPLFALGLGCWLLCDGALSLSLSLDRFAYRPPNSRLASGSLMIFGSAISFGICTAIALGAQPAALLVATLAPAFIAQAVFGRLRALGLALGAGTLIGQIALVHDLLLVTPSALLLAGLSLSLLREHWATLQSVGAQSGDGALSGPQARALLHDFERAGRGWFWETDRTGKISYVSDTLAAQLGCKASDLAGVPFTSLLAIPEAGDGNEEQRTLNFHFSARTPFSDISVRAAVDEEDCWWSVSGQPIVTPFGQFLGFRGSGSDLTAMRRSQAEVARLASVDSLTGLANRPEMMRTLEQALNPQRGQAGDCALFLLDLDRFKEVNDTLGHPAGDALLRQVAQRLLRVVGTIGQVGRIGGDEFKVVLPGMVEVMALAKLADSIIFCLSEPYVIDGSQVVIGASIGIAIAPMDGTNSETLIRNADLALYAAKGEGRGQFRFFVPAMHAEAEDRRQLEVELRQAIGTGGLHLEYQPVVCAPTERITGFESLIRWRHPTRGLIPPATFIPIAEDAGLVGAIGEWVLRTACNDAVNWPEATRVAVNVSPIQFANPALPSIVMSALSNSGLSAERLELEITESVFLADQNNTDGMFAQLKNLGVRLALDDFGTGYSALGYLKTAPFDKIKIDQSFVRGAAIKGSRNAAIVKSIVNLAEALGMETTAEGAETLDELDLIRSLGCSHVQGFVYGRPMPLDATFGLLAEHDGHAVAKGHKSSREPRMTMLRTVMLHHGSNRYTARMRNISTGGAMIEGLLDVPAGTIFEIEFSAGHRIGGMCRWSHQDRMGVEFETAADVERIRWGEKPTESVPPDPAYVLKRRAG